MRKKYLIASLISIFSITTYAIQPSTPSLLPIDKQTKPLSTPMVILKNEDFKKTGDVKLGGFGGNERIGQVIYDGGDTHLPAADITRIVSVCQLMNKNVRILDNKTGNIIQFGCPTTDPTHNNVYWNPYLGRVNGGYSPENDTLYAVNVMVNMFKEWYNIPPIIDEKGLAKRVDIKLHEPIENALLEINDEITLGDGEHIFYPFTSLNVVSYMMSYLFTSQHSNLDFFSQSGAIKIAFACMTAMAAEFYATGKNTWQVGADISKNGYPIHYMDMPSKNCHEGTPYNLCDINTFFEYNKDVNLFSASGIFNRAFYLLATTNGWNTHKAYDIFVDANRFLWKHDTNFHQAACDVVKSAKKRNYDTKSVTIAFFKVGISTIGCS